MLATNLQKKIIIKQGIPFAQSLMQWAYCYLDKIYSWSMKVHKSDLTSLLKSSQMTGIMDIGLCPDSKTDTGFLGIGTIPQIATNATNEATLY